MKDTNLENDENKLTVRRLISLLSQAKSLDDEIEIFAAMYNNDTKEELHVLVNPDWYMYALNGIQYNKEGRVQLTGTINHIYKNNTSNFEGIHYRNVERTDNKKLSE